MHKLCGAEGGRHGLQRGGKHQDQDRRYHSNESLGDAFRHLLEGEGAAKKEVDKREDKRDHTAPWKSDEGIRIAEGCNQVSCIFRPDPGGFTVKTPCIEHGKEDGYNEHRNRKNQIQDFAFRVVLLFIAALQCAEIAVQTGALFGKRHGTVIEPHGDKGKNEHECQK